MHITEPIEGTEESLERQELAYLRELSHVDELGRRKERGRLDSQFVLEVTLEDEFKKFMDEVASTYVMNG